MTASLRVLVAAREPHVAGALGARLEGIGLETATAAGDSAARAQARARPFDAVILDAGTRAPETVNQLAQALKADAAPRLLAVLAITDPSAAPLAPGDGVDAVLRAPAHHAQLAARVHLLVRLAVMEDEARLRARTMARYDADVDLRLDEASFSAPRVLFAGDPHPSFLTLHRALSANGAQVTAAFTSFTAFDFLHERDFDAVIANAVGGREPAFTICSALRRNTRLHHVPALLLTDLATFDGADEAFARGVSDLAPANAEPEELAARVLSLARERRRREAVKDAFARARAPRVTDNASGLATSGFFAEHVDAMARRARAIERPLSMIVLRAVPPRDVVEPHRGRAMRQLASMLRQLVRVEDLASALEPGIFAVAMPGAGALAAEGAAARLEGVADCTAFDGGPFDGAFQIELTSAVCALNGEESGRALLARAVAAFEARRRAG